MITGKTEMLYFKNPKEWRGWLQKNHLERNEVWIIYYKKNSGKPTIFHNDAVKEAICFGWIDGQVKKIDDERYMQRYTPRKPKSNWSEINVEVAKRMIEQGRMMEPGLKAFRQGMSASKTVPSSKNFSVPAYLKMALVKNKKAWDNFQKSPPSARLAYVYWVTSAKTEGTRQKRIKKIIRQLERNRKAGEA